MWSVFSDLSSTGLGWIVVASAVITITVIMLYLISLLGESRSVVEPKSPLKILGQRYTRGEITKTEFERARANLNL